MSKFNLTTFLFLAFALTAVFVFQENMFVKWTLLSFMIVLYLILIVVGSFRITWNFFLHSVNHGKHGGVAFTFDDGPDPETTPAILKILSDANIKAVFFVIGKRAEEHPQLLKTITDQGHIIGNHSYSHHAGIGFFKADTLQRDIENCSEIIFKNLNKRPLYFRPPFGVTNPRYKLVLFQLRMYSIGWTLRSYDTIASNKETLIKRIKSSVHNNSILLFHDTQKVTLDALPEIISYCRHKNLPIVSLPELTGLSPYA